MLEQAISHLIEVDYIGAINITDLVSRGILPSGLTNTIQRNNP